MENTNKDVPEYVTNSGTICERLWSAAAEMLESSLRLEKALIKRDKEQIWEILSEQEKKSSRLNQTAKLWNEVYGSELDSLSDDLKKSRLEIREKLQRLQLTEKVNYSLTRNYLAAVKKSMVAAGAGLAGKKKVYDKGGRLGVRSSSMIFKSIG